ncbi:Two-component response regulator, PleD family, consists of two REC domains and a diguanylate cyclase (GGDEF) domain [Cohaesibacter marisflavi]|uniref:Two-component response regulator, PleD family, consists of two REC domains and a diguanylate cyclase (GGDEF) domain n=1 Tax=Cohaesibacter marisflavi TaxID=655353 RepID=A0A1I5I7S6_9HYPH|nr:diguanylate cyclase [Cohaesibacter marisflavi]SFO56643.1 Two-component response regulator, PleD family, consists of two REC domains and a diguanylate cyclase (GGDEF) domain [Cohaesibacter marisflavi]
MAKHALIFTSSDLGLDTPAWADVLIQVNFAVWSHYVHSDEDLDKVSQEAGILLLDLFDVKSEDVPDLVARADALRKQFGFADARVPMVAIADASISLTEEQMKPFADVLKPPLTQDLIANRLTSLMRLATMRREAERRSLTFKRFGVGLPVVPPPKDLDKQSLLYLGAGAAFLPVQLALPETVETVAALTPSMALHYLEMKPFDALVVELCDYNEHLVEFISELRRNPNYFSFPIILVCHKRAVQDGLAGLAAGATDIVSFPFSERFFENRIDILVREERYRRQLRKIFSEARLLMPTDEVTRLYSEEFLKSHLDVLREEDAGASVTFVGFDITFDLVHEKRGGESLPPALLAKVSRLIASLMRAEDMLARLDNGSVVAFFPDTDLFEARMALQRIRSIVQLSPFVEHSSTRAVYVTLDFSLHYCDTRSPDFDVDKILKDLFENPVVRF